MHQEIQNVGVVLGKKIIDILTMNRLNLPQTQLEIVKFLGVNFWEYVFGKTFDKLQTSHTGTYEIRDNNKFISRISSSASYDKDDFNAMQECKLR